MDALDISIKTRVIFSQNASEKVGELVCGFDAQRVMIVTDRGIQEAGIDGPLLKSLKDKKLDISIFNKVEPNPTTQNVEDGVASAKEFCPDAIIALGGGSPIDTAKGINMLCTRGGQITDYRGLVTDSPILPPLIAIPTTAGTGSEVSPFMLISDTQTHAKIVVRDARTVPDIAVLDPTLTISLPRQTTVLTGVDALVHGFESFVAKGTQPYSQALAMKAIEIIYTSLPKVVAELNNLDGRGRLLIASNMAGIAFAQSYLGLAHATANPLTRVAGMAHGLAVGLMLPYVIQFNESVAKEKYFSIANRIFGRKCPSDPKEATLELASALKGFVISLGYPENLEKAGISWKNLPEIAEDALTQATVKSNPREPSLENTMHIYRCAFEGSEICM